jgi:predicted Zn-dependent protease
MSSYETSLDCFPPLVNGSQNEVSMVRRKAEVLVRLGRLDEAEESLKDAIRKGHVDIHLLSEYIRIAKMAAKKELPEKLIEIVERMDDDDLTETMSEYLLDCGQYEEALRLIGKILEKPEHNDRAVFLEARAYAAAGIPEDEISSLLSELGGGQTARLQGELAEAREEYEEAAAHYRRALSERPSDYASAESLARMMLRLGRNSAAVEAAKTALGIDPDEPGSYVLLARAYRALGKEKPASALRSSGGTCPQEPGRKGR